MTLSERRDHVCFSSIDWDFLWQGPQELMSRFAREGSRVLFVENTGVRRPRLRDWRRILARLRASMGMTRSSAPPPPNVTLLSPVVVPLPWSGLARRANMVLFAGKLPARAARLGLNRPVVWTFLPTPLALDAVRVFRQSRSLAIYYCVADFAQLADDPAAALQTEDALLREVDLVLVGGRVLLQRFVGLHPRVVLAPYSVADHFFGPHEGSVPADVASIPRPRVGYVGGLHRHIDLLLLTALIDALPDVHFVFVGPRQGTVGDLDRRPNAHFLGPRPHGELPAYVDGFDAALVPYELSSFTETVWPTKLHEYLARGVPVVSTPLPEVLLLEYPPGLVRIAETPSAFATAVRAAMAERAEGTTRRIEAARAHSWSALVQRLRVELDRAETR